MKPCANSHTSFCFLWGPTCWSNAHHVSETRPVSHRVPTPPLCLTGCSKEASTACSRNHTALAWLQLPAGSDHSGFSAEAACLLAAASSEGIRVIELQRFVFTYAVRSSRQPIALQI